MLKRDGKGLGFSIAGGKGATPYRGTDEVSIFGNLKYQYDLGLKNFRLGFIHR